MDDQFVAMIAHTETYISPVGPQGYDAVQLSFIRHGSAQVFSDFGERLVRAGDIVILAPNTLYEAHPEGSVTSTSVYVVLDYLIDQTFWQYAAILSDRYHAREYVALQFPDSAQTLSIGMDYMGFISPFLDNLVELSLKKETTHRFYRMQADLAAVLDVLSPFLSRGRATRQGLPNPTETTLARPRPGRPVRPEAMTMRRLLESDLKRRWTLRSLAASVHLSPSQAHRVFVGAYGKTPLAYQTVLRGREMARLLRSTTLPVQEIALRVGWSDRSHAAQSFHRLVGVNPREYRKLLIERR